MNDSFLLNTYPEPKATFVRGKGVSLFDSNGKEYLDFLSGIAVVSLGHSNEEIAQTISRQASELSHVSNYFDNEFTQKVARKIDEKISSEFVDKAGHGKVFFSNSGAEANECAIKVAKRYGKGERYKILTAINSFHGRTIATLKATGQPEKHKNFEPLPDYVKYFEFGNSQSLKDQIDEECVAVLIEVIQGEGGVQVANQEFFDDVTKICKENGLLLMIDEVQTGMCRTGKWFGFQNFGLMPDVVTMAKALGNGFPVGACWVKDEVAEVMQPGDHGSTFGGQPLALAVVDTVFNILDRDQLDKRAGVLGEKLKTALRATSLFKEVRGLGLLVGCELDPDKVKISAFELVTRAMDSGLIINATSENTIRLAPPLIIEDADIDRAVEIISSSARS